MNLLTTDELYDLESDPGEMVNLIGSSEHALERGSLHDQMIQWMHRTRGPFQGYYWGLRPWRPDYSVAWAGPWMTRQREDDSYEPRQLVYETGLEMKESVRKK